MNLFQRATRSCFRKPVKSLLLLLVGLLILFSTCAASVLIFRKKPKDILSEMS